MRGFTLIEILVAFSITAVLSSIGLASFVSYQKRQALDQTILALQNDIAFAKAKAQIQEIPPACVTAAPAGLKGYQLKFGSDGLSYEVLAVCNDGTEISLSPQRIVSFPQNVRKTEGPGWIRFLVLTGSAQAGTGAVSTNPTDGKWEVRVAHGDRAKAISVTTEGGISTLALGSVTPFPTATSTPAPTPTSAPTPTPGPAACADGTSEQVYSSQMVGCSGSVTYDNARTLCASGSSVCSVAAYLNRGGRTVVPTGVWWVSEKVRFPSLSCSSTFCDSTTCATWRSGNDQGLITSAALEAVKSTCTSLSQDDVGYFTADGLTNSHGSVCCN